jgi:hypothetical protein
MGDIDGALDDCRRIIGASRAVGDEPFPLSQVSRVAIDMDAVYSLVRILAQGEASDAALSWLQSRLAEETEVPFTLIGCRGERAHMFDLLGKLADGSARLPGQFDGPNNIPRWFRAFREPLFLYNQALSLHVLTIAVETAKRPLSKQENGWEDWGNIIVGIDSLGPGCVTKLMTVNLKALYQAHKRAVGLLNVAQAMIAMERFRLANDRWPESLEEIPATILSHKLIDPYSDTPVRVSSDDDGWSVYCVGPDGEDDGGDLDPRFNPTTEGTDWGFRLWDPDQRRQAELPDDELPGDVFQSNSPPPRSAGRSTAP